MADGGAWSQGWDQGSRAAQEGHARKEALSEQDRNYHAQFYATQLDKLQTKLSSLDKGSPEYDDTFNQIQNTLHGVRELFHPDRHPGLIASAGHLITDALHITKPEERIQKAGAQRAAAGAGDEKTALGVAAAAPVSPEQEMIRQTNAKRQADIQAINNSDLSPEDKAEARRKLFGVSEKPTLKLYASPDGGTKAWLDASRPDSIPVGWTAYTPVTADNNKRKDFDDYKTKWKAEHNGQEYPGTFESFTAEQAATGRAAAPKPETLDTQYKAILVKEANGQKLTPDEQAHKTAWQLYNKERFIDPGIARAAAFGAMRYIQVVDPNNPENVVMMRAGDAAKAGVNTPQSIAFKTDTAITRYMTTGQGGTNITYFNTATDHLRLLKEAGDALNNGNIQLFNEYANKFATATGAPEPTNFETVKAAVAGELSKTFKGTGATDSEIADINQTINQAQSPQQIAGAIQYYTSLMGSKVHALQLQYEAGKAGKPNFPGTTPDASTPPPAGGAPNQYVYAKDAQGKLHKAKAGTPLPQGWTLTNAPTAK